MTSAEWTMLVAGLGFVAALSAWHLGGLLLLKRIKPSGGDRNFLAVLSTFWGLLLLHVSEIGLGALALGLALDMPGAGSITGDRGDEIGSLIYLAGMSFATLGFSDQSVKGPIHLLVMFQSLGGFMLITWSATFVYSIWQDRFE